MRRVQSGKNRIGRWGDPVMHARMLRTGANLRLKRSRDVSGGDDHRKRGRLLARRLAHYLAHGVIAAIYSD